MNAVKEQKSSKQDAVKRKLLTLAELAEKYKRCVRHGKSRKDRENNARSKNFENKDSRASWQNTRRADGSNSQTFPWSSCNGKRNRYQVTGKDAQTVYSR